MYAERVILETDQAGNVKNLPKLPPNIHVEAIFLVLESTEPAATHRRRPHPDIAGRIRITGDIVDTAPAADWDLPQ